MEIGNNHTTTILITGATDGLGKQTARLLAKQKFHLILHGRNPEKLEKVASLIQSESDNPQVDCVLADFASLDQVRAMATYINEKYTHLDVLINNAGIRSPKKLLSNDGFELTFATNYLATFLLTLQLFPLLAVSQSARVVNLSSLAHRLVWMSPLNFQETKRYWGWVAYARSKLLMVLFSNTLAEKAKRFGISSNALHPGIIFGTKVTQTHWAKSTETMELGALSVQNLAINPDLSGISGAYFDKLKQVKPSLIAQNKKLQQALWKQSVALTQATDPFTQETSTLI